MTGILTDCKSDTEMSDSSSDEPEFISREEFINVLISTANDDGLFNVVILDILKKEKKQVNSSGYCYYSTTVAGKETYKHLNEALKRHNEAAAKLKKKLNAPAKFKSEVEGIVEDKQALALVEKNKELKKAKEEIIRLQKVQSKIKNENKRLQKDLKKKTTDISELKANLNKVQKKVAAPAQDFMKWQWEQSTGEWIDMAASVCRELDEKYGTCERTTINSSGNSYEIDFQMMTLRNTTSNKVREIRLLVDRPANWVRNITVDNRLSREYDTIMKKITLDKYHLARTVRKKNYTSGSCGSNMLIPPKFGDLRGPSTTELRLYQVENAPLWHSYIRHREKMHINHDGLGIKINNIEPAIKPTLAKGLFELIPGLRPLDESRNEVFLFHGTSEETMEKIVMNGFDPRTAAEAAFYGLGVYFASNICKSYQYTGDEGLFEMKRTIIISRVTLGAIEYVDSIKPMGARQKRPSENVNGHPFDSIIAKPQRMLKEDDGTYHYQKHQEFVIFSVDQAYPEFVLQWEEEL